MDTKIIETLKSWFTKPVTVVAAGALVLGATGVIVASGIVNQSSEAEAATAASKPQAKVSSAKPKKAVKTDAPVSNDGETVAVEDGDAPVLQTGNPSAAATAAGVDNRGSGLSVPGFPGSSAAASRTAATTSGTGSVSSAPSTVSSSGSSGVASTSSSSPSVRTVTAASGKSHTYTVSGNLSAAELAELDREMVTKINEQEMKHAAAVAEWEKQANAELDAWAEDYGPNLPLRECPPLKDGYMYDPGKSWAIATGYKEKCFNQVPAYDNMPEEERTRVPKLSSYDPAKWDDDDRENGPSW